MKFTTNRRDFLKQSALAAAFAAFSPAISPLHTRSEGRVELARTTVAKKVIVIGAGLAGLSAAYELVLAGHEVTILEARTRPGGRVYTLREPFSDGLYAEAGAARIPDCHDLTLGYVKHFGLTLDPFKPSEQDTLLFLRGKRIKIKAGAETRLSQLPLALSAAERKLDFSGLWQRYTEAAVKAMGNPASPNWPSAALQKYDRMNFAAFLRRQGASASAIELLEMPYYKPADDSLSALWWLREAALLAQEKQVYKIRGGSDLLPKAFAVRLAEKIRYDAPVTRIHHDERGVSVVYGQANGAQRLTADHLVCANPFSVLRRMEITPPFSPEKQKAIAEQPYDSATRVFLQVRRRYWEREGLNGFATTDLPGEIWHPTFDQLGSRGLLVSYTSGAQARRVAALTGPERVNWLSKRVERIYPGLRENFERGASFCWDEDEWARGAYSILKPGQMFSLLPHIARPEGRVHFAGEHTSAWPAWQQGALASGNRVAREINQAS